MAEQASPDHLAPPTVSAGRIVLLAVAGLIFLAATFFVLAAIYFSVVPRTRAPPPKTFPTPQLRPDPDGELNRLMAEQRRQLSGYRWANPEHTLIKIPIERAMDLVVQRGADAFAPIVPAQAPPQPGRRP
jgi:hypothetical protein